MLKGRGAAREDKPAFASLVRVSPTQQVREQLLKAIYDGGYRPGEALPSERALCDMFQVSRVSVREAIAGLEAMGVVTVQHGRGCFVAEGVSDRFAGPFGDWLRRYHDQMIELLKVRGALDELAASEAARRGDEESLAELDRIHAEFREAVNAGDETDVSALVQLDMRFHAAIARASGSDLLANLLSELSDHMADSRRLTFLSAGRPARSLGEHEGIIAAIRRGDARRAKQYAGEHVAAVRHWIEEHG